MSARSGDNPWIPPVEHTLIQLELVYDNFTLRVKEIGETPYFTNVKLIDRDWSTNRNTLFVFMVLGPTKSKDLLVIVKGDLSLEEDFKRLLVGRVSCRISQRDIEVTRKTTERILG